MPWYGTFSSAPLTVYVYRFPPSGVLTGLAAGSGSSSNLDIVPDHFSDLLGHTEHLSVTLSALPSNPSAEVTA